jgi:hypothetical protein
MEFVLPGAVRAAVDEKDEGIFFRGVKGRRLEQPVLNFVFGRALEPEFRGSPDIGVIA